MQYHSTDKTEHDSPENTNDYQDMQNISEHENDHSSAKIIAIIGYITLVGWLLAIVLHGKHKSRFTAFHLRQSLGLIITGGLLALLPLIGWLMNVIVLLVWFYAIFHAIKGREIKVPVLGDFYQEHLDFIK